MPKSNKFRHPTTNGLYTTVLFIENRFAANQEKINLERALYTLQPYDKELRGKVYKSLKRLYLETNDPTGYILATDYLDGWDHLLKLKASVLREQWPQWEDEMEIRLKSLAIMTLIVKAESGDAVSAKFLATKGWDKRKAGAPSKDERTRQLKINRGIEADIRADAKRIAPFIPD